MERPFASLLRDMFHSDHAVALGRGCWGFALILRFLANNGFRKTLGLPAFLCHSMLAAVEYVGWEPILCDVEKETGLANVSHILELIDRGASVILYPHLLGNLGPILEIEEICRSRGVFLIEDVCQAYGSSLRNRPYGSFGDAGLLSFGHTKIIDKGTGAAVLTKHKELAKFVEEYHTDFTPLANRSEIAQAFNKKYYAAKDTLDLSGERHHFSGILGHYLPLIPKALEAELLPFEELQTLPQRIATRQEKREVYARELTEFPVVNVDPCVPWRYCFRMPGISRHTQRELSDRLRRDGIDVSNWYYPLHWHLSASSNTELKNTEEISQEIFQLWLDDSKDIREVQRIAQRVKKLLPPNT